MRALIAISLLGCLLVPFGSTAVQAEGRSGHYGQHGGPRFGFEFRFAPPAPVIRYAPRYAPPAYYAPPYAAAPVYVAPPPYPVRPVCGWAPTWTPDGYGGFRPDQVWVCR